MNRRHRPKQPDRLNQVLGVQPRFVAGILAMIPFLMVDFLPFKALLAAVFTMTALLAGKRIRWTYFLILTASVTFFHLLAPFGRVLFVVGPMTVTLGALENGLIRSLTLIGMVFLSLSAVGPNLRLPGRFGGLLARTFYYFEVILDGKEGLSRHRLFESLDDLLLERFNPAAEDFGHPSETGSDSNSPSGRTQFRDWRGWPAGLLFMVLPWGLWILEISGIPWT